MPPVHPRSRSAPWSRISFTPLTIRCPAPSGERQLDKIQPFCLQYLREKTTLSIGIDVSILVQQHAAAIVAVSEGCRADLLHWRYPPRAPRPAERNKGPRANPAINPMSPERRGSPGCIGAGVSGNPLSSGGAGPPRAARGRGTPRTRALTPCPVKPLRFGNTMAGSACTTAWRRRRQRPATAGRAPRSTVPAQSWRGRRRRWHSTDRSRPFIILRKGEGHSQTQGAPVWWR